MNVVHITFSDSGGAGIAALRIHKALLNLGVDSKMLVVEKLSMEDTVDKVGENRNLVYVPPRNKVLRKLLKMFRARGYFLNPREKYERKVSIIPSSRRTFFTSPLTRYDLAIHPFVQDADIIHLHWIANIVDYPSFFPKINKPIVWTLHDENLAYGGFHYGRERELFYSYYSAIEDAFCEIKQSALKQCKNIQVVALSRMMRDFYASHSFLSDRKITVIHNGIDTSVFRVLDKNIGRDVYHIPYDNFVIVFCSLYLNEKRKGLYELIEAIQRLDRKDITLLCIGNGRFDGKTSVDIRYTGPIVNSDLLAMTYSSGDVFAFPSFQEAFAQTPLEAIACGLPIVAFPCSGMEELINDLNGVKCEDFSVDALYRALAQVMTRNYDRQVLHDDITNRFSIETIASKYQDLYVSLLK